MTAATDRAAVLLPGGGYSADGPLLMYAGLAVRRRGGPGLAAVWFTPLLTDEPTVLAPRRATAPCLLAGGTADRLWDGPAARSITPHVVEVDGADHGMFVPGELSASAAVLAQVMSAVELFLDQAVWPQTPVTVG